MCGAVPIRDDTTPGIAGQVEEATSIAGPSRAAGAPAVPLTMPCQCHVVYQNPPPKVNGVWRASLPRQFDFVRTIISAAFCAADFWYNTRIVRADDSMRTIHMSTFKAAAAPSASGRRSDHPRPTTQAPAIHRSTHSRSNRRRGAGAERGSE